MTKLDTHTDHTTTPAPAGQVCSWCDQVARYMVDADPRDLDCGAHPHWDGAVTAAELPAAGGAA